MMMVKKSQNIFKEISRIISFLDSCRFHPGAPIFHDAYKGWSCCNKKSTDFTEFLNFKGCDSGRHSNVKPEEPVKKTVTEVEETPVIRKPISEPMKRPDVNTPCVDILPEVNANFRKQMDELSAKNPWKNTDRNTINVGTSCKHGGCKGSYESPKSNDEICTFHPGIPVFHEGYKFWSCCQKKTTDFSTFLSQPGCDTGTHLWIKEEDDAQINCRWDWHQTPSNVFITVYAKNYDYKKSFVKVNPIRAIIKLIFPQQGNGEFNIDLELRGVIDVSKTSASMYGTKIELCMPKAEGGQWADLSFPKKEEPQPSTPTAEVERMIKMQESKKADEEVDSDIDLDDIELEKGAQILELGELARTAALVEEA